MVALIHRIPRCAGKGAPPCFAGDRLSVAQCTAGLLNNLADTPRTTADRKLDGRNPPFMDLLHTLHASLSRRPSHILPTLEGAGVTSVMLKICLSTD